MRRGFCDQTGAAATSAGSHVLRTWSRESSRSQPRQIQCDRKEGLPLKGKAQVGEDSTVKAGEGGMGDTARFCACGARRTRSASADRERHEHCSIYSDRFFTGRKTLSILCGLSPSDLCGGADRRTVVDEVACAQLRGTPGLPWCGRRRPASLFMCLAV